MKNYQKLIRQTILLGSLILAVVPQGLAITIAPEFASNYTFSDLGSIAGVPANYGGLTLLAGNPNVLLIGGAANTAAGALYAVNLLRDGSGHINGFSGIASRFADAAFNDGGVVYGPGGVLFTSRWPVNQLGQLKPGSVTTDKVVNLAPLGVAGSHAALNFVPAGLPGAGQLKLVSWAGGEFYTAAFSPDGSGTFNIDSVTYHLNLIGGPEGFVYIPSGSPGFLSHSLLVSEYSAGAVGTYAIDGSGNPILATRRNFITGLSGAEGAFVDPVTNDFLFSTFGGGNRLVVVRGFAAPPPISAIPEPSTLILLSIGGLGSWVRFRKIKKSASSAAF